VKVLCLSGNFVRLDGIFGSTFSMGWREHQGIALCLPSMAHRLYAHGWTDLYLQSQCWSMAFFLWIKKQPGWEQQRLKCSTMLVKPLEVEEKEIVSWNLIYYTSVFLKTCFCTDKRHTHHEYWLNSVFSYCLTKQHVGYYFNLLPTAKEEGESQDWKPAFLFTLI